jgi:hypothetical protein
MTDTEFLVPLAEIAGVFVGFAALIAVRSGGPAAPEEVAPMRVVVSMGMMTIIAGLTPGVFGRFDLTEHEVWALSSAVVLVAWLASLAAIFRTPESRAVWAGDRVEAGAGSSPRWIAASMWVAYVLLMAVWTLTPIIIIVGVVPDLEVALYYAHVALLLFGAGWTLLTLVFAQRRPVEA